MWSQEDMTALMRAVQHKQTLTAVALLGHGADASVSRAEDGLSALCIAVEHRDGACCGALLSTGSSGDPRRLMPVSWGAALMMHAAGTGLGGLGSARVSSVVVVVSSSSIDDHDTAEGTSETAGCSGTIRR